MKPVLAVGLVFILAACRAEDSSEAVTLDASTFDTKQFPPTLNLTCFNLCQYGRLPNPHEQPAAAVPTRSGPGTAGHAAGGAPTVQQQAVEKLSTPVDGQGNPSSAAAGSPSNKTSQPAGQTAGHSTAHGARRLLTPSDSTVAGSTTTDTVNPTPAATSSAGSSPEPSTSLTTTSDPPATNVTTCVSLDAQAAQLLRDRYRGFKLGVGLSNFFEIFYSIGQLWSAITDLLEQALESVSEGTIQVNADSILLFNMNIASITAWWGSLIQNILFLKSDLIAPLPSDEWPQ